jgi:hypothetical protein
MRLKVSGSNGRGGWYRFSVTLDGWRPRTVSTIKRLVRCLSVSASYYLFANLPFAPDTNIYSFIFRWSYRWYHPHILHLSLKSVLVQEQFLHVLFSSFDVSSCEFRSTRKSIFLGTVFPIFISTSHLLSFLFFQKNYFASSNSITHFIKAVWHFNKLSTRLRLVPET